MTPAGEWEPDAENWVRWARKPGHDAYWYYRDGFFDELVPAPAGWTLEIGCGEGRVCRDLIARGHRTVGIDTAEGLLRAAAQAEARGAYVLAGGAQIPFPDASFHLVVAYNSLQVVDDLESTMDEIGRTLVHGGSLCACVAHPVTDLGQSVRVEESRRVAVRADYFVSRRVDDPVEVDGMHMTFRGWTYNLEHYSKALERAGLHLVSILVPRPTAPSERLERWRDVPLFMSFRAAKP